MSRTKVSGYTDRNGRAVPDYSQDRRRGKGGTARQRTTPSSPSLRNRPGQYRALPQPRPRRQSSPQARTVRAAGGTGLAGVVAEASGHLLLGVAMLVLAAGMLVLAVAWAVAEAAGGQRSRRSSWLRRARRRWARRGRRAWRRRTTTVQRFRRPR